MNQPRESIKDYLLRRLREEGTARFEEIAVAATAHAGLAPDSPDRVRVSFIRKFHGGARPDPRVGSLQPLWDYFTAQDAQATEGATT